MSLSDALAGAWRLLITGDAALWIIIWISLKTSLLGLLIAAPPSIVAGYLIATHRFAGRRILIWLAQAALSLPTVLIGLLLYLMLSRQGPAGGLHWLFSQSGVVAGVCSPSPCNSSSARPVPTRNVCKARSIMLWRNVLGPLTPGRR